MNWTEKINTKNLANKQEKKLAKELGATLTPNSGATAFRKADMELGDLLIESKATDKGSFTLQHSFLEKIEREALRVGKTPVLLLQFKGRTYAILRSGDYFGN